MACGPLLLLQCGHQWPVQPHLEHMESLAGQEDLPGACDFVQLLHACWAVLVVWDFCCGDCCHWCCCFCWQIALTVFEPVRPIVFILSEMAICVQGFHLDVYGHLPADRFCIIETWGDPLWRRGI